MKIQYVSPRTEKTAVQNTLRICDNSATYNVNSNVVNGGGTSKEPYEAN